MRTTYWVTTEGGGFVHERPLHSLERAQALALKTATECSWKCLTPPAPDNEVHVGRGNFRCGTLSAHGVHIRESVDGRWGEEYDVPEEPFVRHKGAGAQVDWTLEITVDRGTDYLADGHDTFYFSGPERTDTGWDAIAEDIADGDEIVEATVRPTPFGRYADEAGNNGNSYPMTYRPGYGF